MKVLLVQTPTGRMEKPIYPLGLAHLAGALKDQHDVFCFDPAFLHRPLPELQKQIKALKPDVVCVSLRNIDTGFLVGNYWYYHALCPTLDTIRNSGFGGLIVLGGSSFTLFAEQIMSQEPLIDVGIAFEAEQSLPLLLTDPANPQKVPGAYWRDGKTIKSNPIGEPPDLSKTPRAAFDIVDPRPYAEVPFSVGIQSKRGCALRCTYCTYPFLERAMRLRPPTEVAVEVEELARLGLRDFALVDSEFGKPRQHALQVAKTLAESGNKLRFSVWLSEDECDKEMVDALWAAGMHHIEFSPDAYDDAMLTELGKTIKHVDIDRALEVVREHGKAAAAFNFFVGTPGEGLGSLWRKLRFRSRIKKALGERYAGVGLAVIRIYPHTAICKRALDEKRLPPNADLLNRAWHYYRGWPATTAFRLLLWLFIVLGKNRCPAQDLTLPQED